MARKTNLGNKNVVFENLAISDKDGSASFFINSNSQTSSLLENGQGNISSYPEATKHKFIIEVETMMLDSWAQRYTGDCDRVIVKCDTQGAENLVAHGGRLTLKNRVVAFYAEVMLEDMYVGQANFDELNRFLKHDCGLVLKNIYPCMHDKNGQAVQMDVLWVKPVYL